MTGPAYKAYLREQPCPRLHDPGAFGGAGKPAIDDEWEDRPQGAAGPGRNEAGAGVYSAADGNRSKTGSNLAGSAGAET